MHGIDDLVEALPYLLLDYGRAGGGVLCIRGT